MATYSISTTDGETKVVATIKGISKQDALDNFYKEWNPAEHLTITKVVRLGGKKNGVYYDDMIR